MSRILEELMAKLTLSSIDSLASIISRMLIFIALSLSKLFSHTILISDEYMRNNVTSEEQEWKQCSLLVQAGS
jgi:hypothetical protein